MGSASWAVRGKAALVTKAIVSDVSKFLIQCDIGVFQKKAKSFFHFIWQEWPLKPDSQTIVINWQQTTRAIALNIWVTAAMEISLHLGAHRTATTSFQAYLNANKDVMAEAGLAIWTPHRTRDGFFAGLVGPTTTLPHALPRTIGRISIELQLLERAGRQELLISEENLIGASRNNLREKRLYTGLIPRLSRIHAVMGGRVRRIGLAIRSYDSYWASVLGFAVMNGHRFPAPADCDHLVTQPRRWRDVISDVAEVFPHAELLVWRFEDYAAAPHRQLRLLSPQTPHRNLMRPAGEFHNSSPSRNDIRSVLSARGIDPALVPEGISRWMPFDQHQQDILQAQYKHDIAWLRDGAGGTARFVGAQPFAATHLPTTKEVTGVISRAINAPAPRNGGYYGTEKQMV